MNEKDAHIIPRDPSRRNFLKAAIGFVALLSGLILGAPLIDSLISPSYRTKKRHFARVAELKNLSPGQPNYLTYSDRIEDAYIRESIVRDVWAVKLSTGNTTVFSPICPHLGCRYNWIAARQEFVCPCHNSVFALDGKVLSGPAPRGLDTLPEEIKGGELFIEWERFKLGIPQKIPV